MFRLDDVNRSIVGTFGVTSVFGGVAWVGTVPWSWPLRVLPAVALVIAGTVLIRIATRQGSTGGGMSSFIKMGKNAKLAKSKINQNKSTADTFIEMGDDSSIDDETEIKDNEHTPD